MDAAAPQIFMFIWHCTIAGPSFPNEGDRFAGKGSPQRSMMPVEFPKVKRSRNDETIQIAVSNRSCIENGAKPA